MYKLINEKRPRAPRLHSYYYGYLNKLETTALSHHKLLQTCTITHIKTFLHQPIYLGVRFRSSCKVLHKNITNNLCHKIRRCNPARSTHHYTLLRAPIIINTKTFFALVCHLRKTILSEKNFHILHCYAYTCFTRHHLLISKVQK